MSSARPDPADCVIRDLIERNAERWPDRLVLLFDSGERFSHAELRAEVRRLAAGLQALGVKQDELVLTWLPNGPLAVCLFLAINYLGAVYVPVNTGYKGGLLEHLLRQSGARRMIADGRLIERLAEVDRGALEELLVSGPERPALPGLRLLPVECLRETTAAPRSPARRIQPWDTQLVIFTSGTTGPSKGVLGSYLHTATTAREFRHVGPEDRNLIALPMFHIGGVLGITFALLHGGSAALVEAFRTQSFWDTVRRLEVSTVGLLGAMVQFLMKQPPLPGEREHPLRSAVIAPYTDEALAFAERFGVDVYTEFNMTELSVPLYAGPNPSARGSCGKPRPGVSLRLVDEHDFEVPVGDVGELILRTEIPWTLSHGYLNDAEATARAWRNGWFHTGDLFRRDAEGNYYFVDRLKDMIRRRGENISSFEVEAELLAHPAVREAAAVAVPGDGGEDEVLAVLAPVPGLTLNPAEVLAFLQPRLAHYMLPRYIRLLPELPKTPTQKVEKHRLRAEGLGAGTWDREAAGFTIRREQLRARETGND